MPVDVEQGHRRKRSTSGRRFEQAGIKVTKIPAPEGCQDGVYTSNWGLVRGKKVLMSRLPNKRQPEEPHALEAVKQLGLQPLILPDDVERFSGQADALPCGDIVFTQSPFRTTVEAHRYLSEWLGYREVIALQTKPARHFRFGPAKTNKLTGWPDSPTYDIDLAISILKLAHRWPKRPHRLLPRRLQTRQPRPPPRLPRRRQDRSRPPRSRQSLRHEPGLHRRNRHHARRRPEVPGRHGGPQPLRHHPRPTRTPLKGGGSIRCSQPDPRQRLAFLGHRRRLAKPLPQRRPRRLRIIVRPPDRIRRLVEDMSPTPA